MEGKFSRTEMLIGNDGMEKLKNAKVAVFGLGGVGSYVVEGLARAGIGSFVLVDNDTVSLTNRNLHLPALFSTTGFTPFPPMASLTSFLAKPETGSAVTSS